MLAFVPIPLVSSTSEGTLFTDFSYPYPTDDSWVELIHPNSNHGRSSTLHVEACVNVRRSYLKFDLSVVPAGKVIISAKLYLYCTYASPVCNIEVDVHKTGDNWNEHTITWNNAPPVGDFVAANTTVDGAYKFYSWAITSYAQSEYNGDKILSIVVKFPMDDPEHPEQNPSYHRDFASKETWKSSRRPYLEICYAEPTLSVSIIPTSVVMDVGQSQTFTSTVSGGTPPYSYQWYVNDFSVPGANGSTWTFTPTAAGSYTVFLNVTDNLGLSAKSNVASVTVNLELTVSISPSSVVMDVGQSQLFTSTVSNGTPPYTYQWYLDDAPVSGATSSDWTFIPESPGSYLVYVNVTDHVGATAKSNITSVTVNPELSVSISPTSVTMNLGDSKAFASSVSGGTSPFTYQWYLDDTPVPSATDPTWTFTPTATGSYTVRLNVTDSVGATALSNSAAVWVNPPLAVSISPSSVVMDVGQSQLFTSTVYNGTPPYTYQWYLDDTPVSGATDPTWTFDVTSPGTYEIYLIVTDNSDPTESNHAIVTVNPQPTVSISPSSAVIDVGQSQLFTSTVSDGTPPFTYQWYLDDTPVPSATNPTWTFTSSFPGLYEVYLEVTDSVGVTVKSNVASVTVNPPPSVSIIPISVTMDFGESQLFTSTVYNGTPPFTYQWYLNGTPVSGATSDSWMFTPDTVGYYLVHLRVTDNVGVSADSNTAEVTVRGCPKADFTWSPISPQVCEVVTFNASASTPNGGIIVSYEWDFDDGSPHEFGMIATHHYDDYGTYTVTLNVTDSEGKWDTESKQITVTAKPHADFIWSPISPQVCETVTFDASSSTPDGGVIVSWDWDFGDTTTGSGEIVTHHYDDYGTYTVTLNVTDSEGKWDTESKPITVRAHPKADFMYTPLYPCVNETVIFDASASKPNGGVIINYRWDFGDDNITIVTDPIITHVYASDGNYNVTLTVTDSEGKSDTTSKIITVFTPHLYSTDYTAYSLGEEFLINVVIVNVTNFYSFEFKLGYNTTLLDAIDVTEGPFLKSFGSTSATWEIHDSEGYVWMNVTLLAPAPPAEGSGILATIKFKVTYAPSWPETAGCILDLYDTKLTNPTGGSISHTVSDGTYEFVSLCVGPMIDVYTQKEPVSGKGPNMPSDAFAPQEEVILYARVSYHCDPVEGKLVAFEVRDADDVCVTYRTAVTDASGIATVSFRIPSMPAFGTWKVSATVDIGGTKIIDTLTFEVGWIVEIVNVETVNSLNQPKISFAKGEHIYFDLTIENIAFVSKNVSFTLVVYDEGGTPIGQVILSNWLVSSGTTPIFVVDLLIPGWAFVGVANVYADAYTTLPMLGGVPYCPEASTAFTIVKA